MCEISSAPLVTEGLKKTYTCSEATNFDCACGFETRMKQKWDAHVGLPTHPCRNGCGAAFSNSSDEGKHAKLYCSSRAMVHVCGIDGCNETSKSLGGIQQHRAGPKHVTPDRKYSCEVSGCEYRHQHPSKVVAHVRQVYSDNKPFVCPFVDGDGNSCGAGFTSNGDLIKHNGVHVETYDIPCPICHGLFKTVRLAAAHQKSVHGEKKFACTEIGCPAQFRVKVCQGSARENSFGRQGVRLLTVPQDLSPVKRPPKP